MVSVPWVTTTPAAPPATWMSTVPARSVRSANVSEAPGRLRNVLTSTVMPVSASPGTAATSSCAVRVGTTPPESAWVIAMVPPRPSTMTRGADAGSASTTASCSRDGGTSWSLVGVEFASGEVAAGPVHAGGGQVPAAGLGEPGAAAFAQFAAPVDQPGPVDVEVVGEAAQPV